MCMGEGGLVVYTYTLGHCLFPKAMDKQPSSGDTDMIASWLSGRKTRCYDDCVNSVVAIITLIFYPTTLQSSVAELCD